MILHKYDDEVCVTNSSVEVPDNDMLLIWSQDEKGEGEKM